MRDAVLCFPVRGGKGGRKTISYVSNGCLGDFLAAGCSCGGGPGKKGGRTSVLTGAVQDNSFLSRPQKIGGNLENELGAARIGKHSCDRRTGEGSDGLLL